MIVRNEERFLREALESVQGVVDEICIVDTGSTDGTVAVAESFGARIEAVAWRDDFGWARNRALAMATRSWIFVLDADERLQPESRDALRALASTRPDGRGRWIRCRNFADDIRGTGASSNAIVRIFPNDPAVRYRGAIHEFVARAGEPHSLAAATTPIEIHHFGYLQDVVAGQDKAERNLAISRAAYDADPDDPANAYNYGMSALLAGDHATARRELQRSCDLTEHQPRGFRPQALSMLANLELIAGEGERALETASRCATIAPTFPDAHFMRGRVLVQLGRLHEARDAFVAAIEAGAHADEHFVVDDEIAVWKAANEIAAALMTERRYAEAEPWLDRALALRPGIQILVLNRARCREAQGDLEGALIAFRAAFEAYRDERAAVDYVNFVFRHGGPDVCVAAAESALPVLSEDSARSFLVSAAAVVLRAGREEQARSLVERSLTVGDPRAAREIVLALARHFEAPGLVGFLPAVEAQAFA